MCDSETLNQILETLIEFKDEIKTLRVEFQRVHEEFEQLKKKFELIEDLIKAIDRQATSDAKIRQLMNVLATLMVQVDNLSKVVFGFKVPDPGGGNSSP